MHFDALTLACVAAELNRTICPGRVQSVVLPDEHSVGLEVYAHRQRQHLLLSAHPQASRVHLVDQKLRRGVEKQTPLLLLLRKYVDGARLDAVQQPDPWERVFALRFDHPEHGATTLVLEPMGRFSNLLLLGPDGRILDCLNRVPPGDSARRVLLPKHVYRPPPAQDRLPPLDDGSEDYYERLGRALRSKGPLWRALVDNVAGVSPTLAREVAWRATGDAEAPTVQGTDNAALLAVVGALQALWSLPRSGNWQSGLVVDDGDEGDVIGFAPYELHFRGEFVPTASISDALARFYASARRDVAGSRDPYAVMRGGVAALIDRGEAQIARQLEALSGDEPAPGETERLRLQAEWLLALASQIGPDQETLSVDLGHETLHIDLDPQRSPVEQAQRMFSRAAKLERAAQFIPQRREQLQADLAFLEQLRTDLDMAQNQPEIAAVREELREAGFLRQRSRPQARLSREVARPTRFLSPEGYTILVGRNARQNEVVTFEEARAEDLWLHVRDMPGAHVVVRSGGQAVGKETIQAAAQMAAYFSSRRGDRAVPVAVTQRRFVTRMVGGRPGQIHYRNEETVVVPAQMPDL